jgi:hypothetical protein
VRRGDRELRRGYREMRCGAIGKCVVGLSVSGIALWGDRRLHCGAIGNCVAAIGKCIAAIGKRIAGSYEWARRNSVFSSYFTRTSSARAYSSGPIMTPCRQEIGLCQHMCVYICVVQQIFIGMCVADINTQSQV